MSDEEVDLNFDLDFGNATAPQAVDGEAIVVISDVQVQKAKNTEDDGSPRHNFVVTHEVQEPAELSGLSFKKWIYIYKKNPWDVLDFCAKVLGMETEELQAANPTLPQLMQEVMGKTVGVTCEAQEYNGRPSTNVKFYWTPNEVTGMELGAM